MLTLLGATAPAATSTFCNPINIDYRFSFDRPSHREAADPTMVVHGSTYWLFPSKSGGYWHSEDMNEWTFVEPTGLPIETYAPMVVVLGELWYWTAFNAKAIFRTEVRQSDLTLTEVRQSNPNPNPNPNPNQDPNRATKSVGTKSYWPPELYDQPHAPASGPGLPMDLWALGVLLYILLVKG